MRARKELGLRFPLHVSLRERLETRHGPARGLYRGLFQGSQGFGHYLLLKATLDPEDASGSLWHEFAHAQQCEGFINRGVPANEAMTYFRRSYANAVKAAAYEVEAFRLALERAHDSLVTVARLDMTGEGLLY